MHRSLRNGLLILSGWMLTLLVMMTSIGLVTSSLGSIFGSVYTLIFTILGALAAVIGTLISIRFEQSWLVVILSMSVLYVLMLVSTTAYDLLHPPQHFEALGAGVLVIIAVPFMFLAAGVILALDRWLKHRSAKRS